MEKVEKELERKRNSCVGVLIGLAAGDRNGGPVRMAVRLAESLVDNKTYNRNDIIQRYFNWFQGPPHDPERAFDTGNTFANVFMRYKNGKSIDEAVSEVQQRFGSAGVNVAHRSPPIAMCAFISDDQLAEDVKGEASITHQHQLSYEVALATNVICRELIKGTKWTDAIHIAKKSLKDPTILDAPKSVQQLDTGGFAPEVLKAAIYFVETTSNFSEAVHNAIKFAGEINFCPVLVGAFAGALYGVNAIAKEELEHVSDSLKSRLVKAANSLAATWTS